MPKISNADESRTNLPPRLKSSVEEWQRKLEDVQEFLDDLDEHLARLTEAGAGEGDEGDRLRIDFNSKLVTFGGEHAKLAPAELKLMNIFLRSTEAMSVEEIARQMRPERPSTSTVRVYVALIRQKLKSINPGADPIETVRYGYRWRHDIATPGD